MDYLFYSLYYFYSDGGKKDVFFLRTPEDSALSIIALDSASIIATCIYLLMFDEYVGYDVWILFWGVLAGVIYFLLIKFYNCEKTISKMRHKKTRSRHISLVIVIVLSIFSFWLAIDGLKFIYSIINASCLEIP
jgi:hypothetical protein